MNKNQKDNVHAEVVEWWRNYTASQERKNQRLRHALFASWGFFISTTAFMLLRMHVISYFGPYYELAVLLIATAFFTFIGNTIILIMEIRDEKKYKLQAPLKG